MATPTVRFAPGIEGLAALGVERADDLFADPPRVASRGLLVVRRFRSGAVERLRLRATRPPSSSPAAREWNLICHLRAHGVAVPELVLLAEQELPRAASESVLIVRALAGFEPLSSWLARPRDPRERRRGLRATGLALAALLRSSTWLPHASADTIQIHSEPGAEGECAAAQIAGLRSERALLRGLRVERLPSVAFTDLREGRILRRFPPERRGRWLRALAERGSSTLAARERSLVAGLALERDRRALAACARG